MHATRAALLLLLFCGIFVDVTVGPVAQLDEHRAVTREVVSPTPAGPSHRVLK